MTLFKSWLIYGSDVIWMNRAILAELVDLPDEAFVDESLKFTFQIENGDHKYVISPGEIMDPSFFWETQAQRKDLLIHSFTEKTCSLGGYFPGLCCDLNPQFSGLGSEWGFADFEVMGRELSAEVGRWELVQIEEWVPREVIAVSERIEAPFLFLDRDNVIIQDVPYNKNPELVCLMPNLENLLKTAQKQGFVSTMVSNQSGVGRGLMNAQDFWTVQSRVNHLLKDQGCSLDFQFWAFYHNSTQSDELLMQAMDRKPRAGMFWKMRDSFVFSKNSIMVGDKASDLIAAYWGGIENCFLYTNSVAETELKKLNDFKKNFSEFQFYQIKSLKEVEEFILK